MKYEDLTSVILECCFEVSNELGAGFLESVYERSLVVAFSQRGLEVRAQTPLKVKFRNVIVGDFYADLIVEGKVLIELKTVIRILSEHKAQVINYLNATGIEVGLLVNFANPKLEYYRLHPSENPVDPVNPV
ncbi:MAG: GxxExxY protein [Pyrinomonadaceae bacterium]|nr:GxxExxY protein [Pyrinomonadaceae bacterium]